MPALLKPWRRLLMWHTVLTLSNQLRSSSARLCALIAFWIAISCNLPFFQKIIALNPEASGLFVVTTAILLWAYLNLFLQLICWSVLTKPLLWVMLFVSTSTAYCIYTFGVGIDVGQVQNLMETDFKESTSLLTLGTVIFYSVVFFPVAYLIWSAPRDTRAVWRKLRDKLLAMLISVLAIGAAAGLYYADYAATFRENRELRDYVTPHNFIAGLQKYYKQQQPMTAVPFQPYGTDAQRINLKATQQPKLLVFVLGETARAESFSLGGYTRNTNPKLSQQNITYFDQVSSCGTATATSLPCIFSGLQRTDYDSTIAKNREGLLDIVQRAGYKVTWIDNQSGCKGVCDRVEQAPLLEAVKPKWCTDRDYCLDGILVDTLQDFLQQQPLQDRVIVMHQIGSHGPSYYQRYPRDSAPFMPDCATNAIQTCEPQALINSYDNSIAYTDQVLSSLIDQLAQDTRYQSSLLYVSDHGESTGESGLYLHGAPYMFAPSQQTHVPMLAWFSPTFQAEHPVQVRCVQQQQHAALSHDNIFHSILGLLEIQTALKNPELDLSHCAATNGSPAR